jgi:hypothetical protein
MAQLRLEPETLEIRKLQRPILKLTTKNGSNIITALKVASCDEEAWLVSAHFHHILIT